MSDFLFVHSSVDDAGLKPLPFRLLCHLSRRAGKDGLIYPSLASMVKTCGVKIKAIRKALQELERMRVITTEFRNGGTPLRRIQPVSKWKIDPYLKSTPPQKREGSEKGNGGHPKRDWIPLPKKGTQRYSPEGDPIKSSPPIPPRGGVRWKNKILVDELYGLFPRRERRSPQPGEMFRDKFELGKVLEQHDAEGIRNAITSYAATFTASEIEPGSYVAKRGRHIDSLSNWCATEGWKVIHRFPKGSMNREATSIVGEAAVRS
jgi:hypothetical protein